MSGDNQHAVASHGLTERITTIQNILLTRQPEWTARSSAGLIYNKYKRDNEMSVSQVGPYVCLTSQAYLNMAQSHR